MATEIRRTTNGKHPTKKDMWGGGTVKSPLKCFAQVLATVGPDAIAISMNGTAVFTREQFAEFFLQVQSAESAERLASDK